MTAGIGPRTVASSLFCSTIKSILSRIARPASCRCKWSCTVALTESLSKLILDPPPCRFDGRRGSAPLPPRADEAAVLAIGVLARQARGVRIEGDVSVLWITEQRVGREIAINTILIFDVPYPITAFIAVSYSSSKENRGNEKSYITGTRAYPRVG